MQRLEAQFAALSAKSLVMAHHIVHTTHTPHHR